MDVSTIVLVLTILTVIGGTLLALKGTFWLVDEFHKEKPFGFDFSKPPPKPKTMASAVLQRRPKPPSAPKPPTKAPEAPPNAFEEAMKPKPVLGEATQRKPRKRVQMPKGNVTGIPPGAKKLDI